MCKHQAIALPSREVLSKLACEDPQAFEALRTELIENCISRAPDRVQIRLRQLQFRIDGIRRRSGSPLGALLKIQALMWESFFRMDHELQRFARTPRSGTAPDPIPRPVRSARVIEFQARMPVQSG